MSERYYAPDLTEGQSTFELSDEEAHHLARVCRAKAGDRVELFNGMGLRAFAEVAEVGKKRVLLTIQESKICKRSNGLILGCATPKGERADWLVEKATELGVDRLELLTSERSIVDPKDAKLDKLRRKSIEACKQCGRDWLMNINGPTTVDQFLKSKPTDSVGWFLDPTGESIEGDTPSITAVGPEGGWTPTEVEAARNAGWTIVRLPGNILRIETAAIAVSGWSIFGRRME